MSASQHIHKLTPFIEDRIRYNPLLNIDTFIIPSPYINDASARKDLEHSYIWKEEGEILGYLLTYVSADASEYLIYKIVTSPYGRGRGIGAAFIEHLADSIPEKSRIYLYIWEKQHETVEYFRNKGFEATESIVYRNMVYHRLSAEREQIVRRVDGKIKQAPAADEIGKTRHDARKTLRSLTAMVNALAPENAGRIIEDINRETTTLVNMLNMYRDSMALAHEVNLQDLLLERLVPYLENSSLEVALTLKLSASQPVVLGHWLNIGRALVNLASNAIDAMEDSGREPRLSISLENTGEQDVLLTIEDNGTGIPAHLLEKKPDGRPAFIGRSTKGRDRGEGLGTAQVWSTFGARNLEIASTEGEGTRWQIRFARSKQGLSKQFSSLQRRFYELQDLYKAIPLDKSPSRTDIIAAIWQLRKREIFLFEVLECFSRRHNIRDLYRVILAYIQGIKTREEFIAEARNWEGEHEAYNQWICASARRIRDQKEALQRHVDLNLFKGAMLKSYGQSLERVIIFTLNPADGNFLATDRKLAEHLDFVPFIGGDKNVMLRGEFVGDANVDDNPIYLGVWSIDSEDDLKIKLQLLRQGARSLLDFGIHPSKRLAFYQTTYVRHVRDINSDASSTLGDFAYMSDWDLKSFIRDADDEMNGFLSALD